MSSQPVPSDVPSHPVLTAPRRSGAFDGGTAATSTLAVPSDASGCATARHWTALRLAEFGVRSSEVRADAELIVTELVSNAVLHGAAPIVVALACTASVLEVSVTDGGGPPYLFGSLPHDATATRGRGLAIVATLTPAWGVRALRPGPGKTVWCRLRTNDTDG